MAHDLTETATHTAAVTVPDPGDNRAAASVGVPFQALANRTCLANDRLTGVATDVVLNSAACTNGLEVAGTLVALNDLSVVDNATVGGNLNVSGNAAVTGTFGAGACSMSSIVCSGSASFGSVTATSMVVNGPLTTTEGLSVGNGVNTGTLLGADANTTYSADDAECVIADGHTALRTYDIAVANHGQKFEVVNLSATQGITVRGLQGLFPGAPSILATNMINTSGNVFAIRLRRVGTNWRVTGISKVP